MLPTLSLVLLAVFAATAAWMPLPRSAPPALAVLGASTLLFGGPGLVASAAGFLAAVGFFAVAVAAFLRGVAAFAVARAGFFAAVVLRVVPVALRVEARRVGARIASAAARRSEVSVVSVVM
jgi:hypothetical protein